MTLVVTVVVLSVEYCLRIFGRWFSRTWLSDSHHGMEADGSSWLGDPLSHNLALKKFVDQGWQLVYHSLFAFWEYLLLRKYNWFEGERLFFSVSEEEITPDSIKLLFISQIVLPSNPSSSPGSLAVPGVSPRLRQPAQEGLLRAVHPPHRYSQSVLYSFPWPFLTPRRRLRSLLPPRPSHPLRALFLPPLTPSSTTSATSSSTR